MYSNESRSNKNVYKTNLGPRKLCQLPPVLVERNSNCNLTGADPDTLAAIEEATKNAQLKKAERLREFQIDVKTRAEDLLKNKKDEEIKYTHDLLLYWVKTQTELRKWVCDTNESLEDYIFYKENIIDRIEETDFIENNQHERLSYSKQMFGKNGNIENELQNHNFHLMFPVFRHRSDESNEDCPLCYPDLSILFKSMKSTIKNYKKEATLIQKRFYSLQERFFAKWCSMVRLTHRK